VRYEQWHGDLRVFNASAAILVDDAGVIRSLSASTASIPVQDLRPAFSAGAALRAAYQHAPVAGHTTDARVAELGLYTLPGMVYLVYRVELPAVPALLAAPTLYVDAHDGHLIRKDSRIRFAQQGKVFMLNPVDNATPQMVDLQLSGSAMTLENTQVKAVNCIDQHGTTHIDLGGFALDVHTCSEIPKAQADGSFNFLFDPVLDGSSAGNEDTFAEVQMFYHVNRVYDFFRGFGFSGLVPSLPGAPSQILATVNFRVPIDTSNPPSNLTAILAQLTNVNGSLYPFDNAFYLSAASAQMLLPRDRDSMLFGQGTHADFSYDADVVYHEFTHAVVGSTSQLTSLTMDDFGLDSAPGAMNEGFADYFSSALAGDPGVGEYAGQGLPGVLPSGAIRDLGNTLVCPDLLWGEVHQDSQAFSGGLWQARSAVAAGSRATFDLAVYTAMAALDSAANFEAAATAVVEQVRTRLGNDTANATQTIFQNRGLLGCNNRIISYTTPRSHVFAEGTGTAQMTPYAPGYMQFEIQVPAGKNQITVSWEPAGSLATAEASLALGGGGADLRVIFARDTPIEFVYEGQTIGNTGDFTEVAATDTGRMGTSGHIFEARLSDNVTAGTYYAMLVNAGQGQGVVSNFQVQLSQASVAPDAGTPAPDGGTSAADGGTVAGAPDGGTPGTGGAKGGGCSAAGADSAGMAALLGILGVVALLRRRRRRS
jgi:uncharacterized protein (TIGR03382 family)